MSDGDPDLAMLYVMATCVIFIWPYLFCYFASLAIDRISNTQRTVCDLNWYYFPLELRKCFILTIKQSQRPIYFDGLKLVGCTLESFGAVTYLSTFKPFSLILLHVYTSIGI